MQTLEYTVRFMDDCTVLYCVYTKLSVRRRLPGTVLSNPPSLAAHSLISRLYTLITIFIRPIVSKSI